MDTLTIDKIDVARILIVDSLMMCRQAMVKSLSGYNDVAVVADVGSVSDARIALKNVEIDVVILNVNLADGSGIELAEDLKSLHPCIKVVLMSAQDDEQPFLDAVRVGADGYLLKSSPYTRFLSVLRSVISGTCAYDYAVSSSVIRRVFQNESDDSSHAEEQYEVLPSLSVRERQVLELLSNGLSNKEISNELNISISTTKTHISRIFKRLGITSRRELLPKLYKIPVSETQNYSINGEILSDKQDDFNG